MNIYFLDSSALAKRYLAETGADWVRALATPSAQTLLIIARITWVEVLSAFARRRREGALSQDAVQRAVRLFRYDWNMQYRVIELDSNITKVAGTLIMRYPLRAYDAVQLASALQLEEELTYISAQPLTFLVADTHLATIAQAEGLQTDNPNLH